MKVTQKGTQDNQDVGSDYFFVQFAVLGYYLKLRFSKDFDAERMSC